MTIVWIILLCVYIWYIFYLNKLLYFEKFYRSLEVKKLKKEIEILYTKILNIRNNAAWVKHKSKAERKKEKEKKNG